MTTEETGRQKVFIIHYSDADTDEEPMDRVFRTKEGAVAAIREEIRETTTEDEGSAWEWRVEERKDEWTQQDEFVLYDNANDDPAGWWTITEVILED